MNPRVPHCRLFAVLGLLALLCAQVFGVTRGYQCDCTGRLEMTAQDHCHGPHHDDCHHDQPPGHAHEEGDGSGDRQEHQEVRDEVDSRLVQDAVDAPDLVPVLIAVLEDAANWTAQAVSRVTAEDVPADTGPPPGVAVARTTVLLI